MFTLPCNYFFCAVFSTRLEIFHLQAPTDGIWGRNICANYCFVFFNLNNPLVLIPLSLYFFLANFMLLPSSPCAYLVLTWLQPETPLHHF